MVKDFKNILLILVLVYPSFTCTGPVLSEERIRDHFCPPDMANLPISDWKNPTMDDYFIIQQHLNKRRSMLFELPDDQKCFEPNLEGWIRYRLGRLQLVDTYENPPQFEVVYINNNPAKKDKCIICYAGYSNNSGRDYVQGLNYLIKSLKKFGFDGHLIYRIGGWPSLQRDRLKLADVPYAFKPLFFEEVRDLGYKKILWLDSAAMPVKSLNPLFKFMEKHGCCFFAQWPMPQESLDQLEYVARSLNITKRSGFKAVLTQIVGFDLDNPKAAHLLDRWIKAAEKKVPFLEPSADQFSFALLAHELDMLPCVLPNHYYEEGGPRNFRRKHSATIIFHQYEFLNPELVIPEDVF